MCSYVKLWYQNWNKNLFAKNMDDKNDEYSHIIKSVCSRLLKVNIMGLTLLLCFLFVTFFYRDVLEQYYLVWFNLIGGIIHPQYYLVHKIFLLYL